MAEYLKLPEVARRLDVSEKTARRYVKMGALPSVFIGGAYRVSAEDLESYLEGARVDPGKAPALPSPEPSFNDVLEEERRAQELDSLMAYATSRAQAWEGQAGETESPRFSTWQAAVAWEAAISDEFDALIKHIDEHHSALVGETIEGAEAQEIERVEQAIARLWAARKAVGRQVGRILRKVSEDVQDPEGFARIRRARRQAETQTSARVEGLREKLGA